MLPQLLERCRYKDFARGLCVLDPYGLSVDYDLLKAIAAMNSVEIFFNFMLVAANRNILWNIEPSKIPPGRAAMMTRVWGHDRWQEELYDREPDLFGETSVKVSNERVVEAYRKRLLAAGFKFVPQPIAMKNRMNAALYIPVLLFTEQGRCRDRQRRHGAVPRRVDQSTCDRRATPQRLPASKDDRPVV